MNTTTTNTDPQTLEFAQTIREAHIQILKALETLQKNAFFTTDWIDNNGVLYSLSFEIEKNLEDVLFNDLFKVVDVLKEKGVDYEPIQPMEYVKNESSQFTTEPISEELEAAYLALRTKEILTDAERNLIFNDDPETDSKYLNDIGKGRWLNINVYSEHEHEAHQLRMEQGL
jgi:hypothetical protein